MTLVLSPGIALLLGASLHSPDPRFDFGDAPPSFPTVLEDNGARHGYNPDVFLGRWIDSEPDGQTHDQARGDDMNGLNDEDGVVFGPLVAGTVAHVTVQASTEGFLNAWVDFDGNGTWQTPEEQVFTNQQLAPGPNRLAFTVPPESGPGPVVARFRFSTVGGLSVRGEAPNGEVEDYLVELVAAGALRGRSWDDQDGDGLMDPGEPGLSGWTVFLDNNRNGWWDTGEPACQTGDNGQCEFVRLTPGLYWIGQESQPGWEQTSRRFPGGVRGVTVGAEPEAQANGWSEFPSISANGRYMAFESAASNLAPPDTHPYNRDVIMHDRQTGQTERLSASAQIAGPGNNDSGRPSVSADGRHVAFQSWAADLVANDSNNAMDVFVYDRETRLLELVSVNPETGEQGNRGSSEPSISADGRYVAFHSQAVNLVETSAAYATDVFVFDRQTRQIERVSVNPQTGQQGSATSVNPSISADGRYVAFDSWASNLVEGDNNNKTDVFVYDRTARRIERVSVNPQTGLQGNGSSSRPALSADGRYVAFESQASNLAENDTNNRTDVFVYDRELRQLERLSVNPLTGDSGDSNSEAAVLSADGRYVAFQSDASNLIENDSNNRTDVFVYDRETRLLKRVSVNPQTGEQANDSCGQPSISADGRQVVFQSWASNLVESDANQFPDIFVSPVPGTSHLGPALAYVGPGQTVAVDFGNRQLLDYGDAPGPFLTLKSANGARHHVVPRYCLGSNIDLEPEGQPHPAALGDDLNPTGAPNDEDGVRFLGPPVPGTMAQVEVTVNMATMNGQSLLQAWIDFDGDQDWSDPAEQIFTDVPLTVGPNVLSFLVPPETVPGTSMARFRLSTQAGLAFAGEAPDGEVEDYGIEIDPPLASIDLEKFTEGDDADTAPGPTLVVGDPVEWTYQVKNTGNVPLSNIQVTDDHGVVVTCPWTVLGVGESMVGQATGTVVLGQYGNVGTVTARALDGSTVSDTDSSHYLGAATPMDYGDAPDPPYPTLLASNGARHRMVPGGVRLGARLDGEAEGQPTAGADGDDRVRSDDEDGVRFLTPWVMGNTAAVEVLSDWGSAYLNAWADWNRDGDWADAGEQIVTNQWLTARLTTVSVLVPKRIAAGACVVRFRLSTQTRVSFDGEAADGEVEDYVREVREGGGIAGVKFDDWDGDGERDANEPGLAGWTIFLDADGDGQKGAGELAMTTGADGAYGFAGLIPGVYWVAEVPQAGWVANQTQLPYEIHRVSQSATGEAGNHSSVGSTLSADGRFVAFQSWADNLLGAGQDNNQCSDVFVVDRLNKAIQRVSQSASGEAGNQVSYWPSLSADGRFVAFASLADNLLEAGQDNNQCSDVFVVDRLTGAIQRVSQSGTGEAGNLSSQSPSLSADGRFVAFHSRADNLLGPGQDTNHRVDAFVVDRLTGAIQRVSQSASGEAGNGDSWYPSLSADGRFVAFVSYADNLLGVGQDMNQRYDVFVVDRWTEAIQRVSQSASGEAGNGDSESPSLSADGQFVAFDSWANNLLGVGQDINNRRDVFMADRLTGAIQRVSQSTNKDPGNEDSYSPSLSADGQFVAFDSWANNLLGVGQDINNRRDVFMVDRLTGAIQRVSQSASGETGNGDSWYPSLSADGRFIAFHSAADNLLGLGQDNNQCSDVFVVSTSKPIDGPRIVVLPSGQTVAVDFGNQQLLDYGDAPAPYPTLRGDDGARHHYNPEVYLGYALDLEPNGQPNGGDDLNPPGGPNDEDGVLFKGGMVQGPMASVEVIASIQGYLNAWIDFNGDGDWDDADEQLFQDMIIGPGKTPLSFPVPADAVPQSHARFRLSTQPGLSYFGEATDGEVEDYVVEIAPRGLINGGAEMGSLDGWTGSSGMVAAVTEIGQATGTVRPKEGAFFFSLAQQPGSEATLTQTGLLRPGFSSLHLSGYFLSERLTAPEADDFGEVVLAVLDAEGNVLAEVASGPLVATENLRWEAVLLTSSVPEQAVTWKVQLCGVGRAGDRLNVYYDGWLLEYRNADSSYAAWASAQIEDPAQRDEGDDADGDGLVNLIEFAMELDPQVPESLGEVFWLTVGSEGLMTGVDVFFRQSKFSAGVSMEVRHTPDLAQPFSARLGGGPFVAEDHGDYVIQRIQFTDGAKAGGFFQLIVRPD